MSSGKNYNAKFVLLGCGGSTGVPAIGNNWGACNPNEPKNYRTRASVCIEFDNKIIIIDTGPDFREQFNRTNYSHIDAVLYTHPHSDHSSGMDELRVISLFMKKIVPVYASLPTMEELQVRFASLFRDSSDGLYKQAVEPNIIKDGVSELNIEGLEIISFPMKHGRTGSTGFRIGDFAYCTDMYELPEESITALKGINNWVVDGSGYHNNENPAHASIDKIYELNGKIRANNVYITHLTPFMDYNILKRELRSGYFPAFDGMEIQISFCEGSYESRESA